ncbi:MAG: radical SAM family heme chaperone HemW [Phycisphaerales bacterium]
MPDDTALHILRQRPTQTARAPLEDAAARGGEVVRSLYLHVPFCEHKCHYCDFYSFVDTRDRQAAFVRRLIRECRALAPLTRGETIRTVFVGGGTPTLLAEDLWTRLLTELHQLFRIDATTEFTVECNPETATPVLFARLADGGVNRLSIGAQSFDPRHLRTLERLHDPEKVLPALEMAHAAGIHRCSVDLIYAIPGQSLADLDRDLDRALDLPIEHLSAYNLTYEPNTAMTKRLARGEFNPVDEDDEARMFERVGERLAGAGFVRYEVSNYAKPGRECRHNLAYWRQESWLAAGPSASAHVGGHRFKVVPRLDDYLARDDEGYALIVDHEPPDPRRSLGERLMTGLRLAEGIDRDCALRDARRIDDATAARLQSAERSCIDQGWLDAAGDRWTLTPAGILFADAAAAELLSAVLG